MPQFRKKPVVIEAVRYTGKADSLIALTREGFIQTGKIKVEEIGGDHLNIETLEGILRAQPGDWIIRGVKGEYYPCKPDIFAATYEPV